MDKSGGRVKVEDVTAVSYGGPDIGLLCSAGKVKRLYYGLIPLPWLLAGLLFMNGALDTSKVHSEQARVISKFSMPGPMASRRLIVTSWRDGHHLERVPVDRVDFDRFTKGDSVDVQVKDGLVSIPWVTGVSMRE